VLKAGFPTSSARGLRPGYISNPVLEESKSSQSKSRFASESHPSEGPGGRQDHLHGRAAPPQRQTFHRVKSKRLKCSAYVASSIKGAAKFGRPVNLEEVRKIDLIFCGSVAVNRKGARVGKGGGYSDLEFGLLTEERRIDRHTPIVTSVHPLQIVNEQIPMTEHDIPLNAIATPDEFIKIQSPLPRPKGIYWEMLPPEKIADIPVLKNRKQRLVK